MTKKSLIYLCLIIFCLLSAYSVLFLFSDQAVISLTKEDCFYENLTAIFFLLASLIFFIDFLKDKKGNDFYFFKTKRNYFFLLLAIVFFLGFGEEISWGQRIFHLKTPEVLKEINVQNEINIHNLLIFEKKVHLGNMDTIKGRSLNIDRLFTLFWLSYCFVIPVINRMNSRISRWLKLLNLPLVPIWIGSCFILNYLISKIISLVVSLDLHLSVVEIKECLIAFLFFAVSIFFLNLLIKSPNPDASA